MRNWQTNSVRRPTACGHSVPRPWRACDNSSILLKPGRIELLSQARHGNSSILLKPGRFPMSNDLHDDESLFGGFDALVPPLLASLRAVEQTRELLRKPIEHPEAALTGSAGKASGRTSLVPQTSLPAT